MKSILRKLHFKRIRHMPSYGSVMEVITICEEKKARLIAADRGMS